MTAIAALETDTGVWICSDKFVGGDDWADNLAKPKWTVSKNLVVAASGPMRAGQLVELLRLTAKHKAKEPDDIYLMRAFAEPARVAVTEAEIPEKDLEEFNALLIFSGKIYLLDSEFTIHTSSCRYNAIGSGAKYCMGSLFSTTGDPKARVEKAVDAAAEHHPSVRGRFPALFVPTKGPIL